MRETLDRMSKTLLVALAAAVAVAPVTAGRDVDRTLKADPRGTLEIEMGAGILVITGWDRDEVQIRGTVPEGEEMFAIDEDGDTISIEVNLPEDCDDCGWDWDDDDEEDEDDDEDDGDRRHRHRGRHTELDREDARLEIRVPRGTSLEIEGIAADVTIENVDGEVSIEAVAGDVSIQGGMTELEVEVVSGKIEVDAGRIRDAEVSAVSGNIVFRSDLDRRAGVSLQSVSGDIAIYLPKGASCRVAAQSFNGDIDSAFGAGASRRSDDVPAKSLQFTLGSGDADISLQTFNGDIDIRER